MRQIISLEKEILFKTMIGDITSISLEHTLDFINNSEIEGDLIVNGTYKLTEASTIEEPFDYKVPVEIMLTTALEEKKRTININDFTYKIVNEDTLLINVDLLIEGLEMIEIKDQEESNRNDSNTEIEILSTKEEQETLPSAKEINDTMSKEIEQKNKEQPQEVEKPKSKEPKEGENKVIDSIFTAFKDTTETYSTYSVYTLRENDTLDEIIAKYKTTRDDLQSYNDLDNLKIGTKLIIPTSFTDEE